MSDIVKELRGSGLSIITHWCRTVLEGRAAAEIERLRAALAEVHLTINALYTERDKARAALAEAREALSEIANQKTTAELKASTDFEGGDFEYACDCLIEIGRKWLEKHK